MSETIYYEIRLLTASACLGLGLMMVYDCLRVFRMVIPHSSLWTGMEDTFYWLASSFATFRLLFGQNDGILRWYAIAGVLLGMLLYNMTVSRILMGLLKKIEKWLTIKKIERQKRRSKRKRKGESPDAGDGKGAETEKGKFK